MKSVANIYTDINFLMLLFMGVFLLSYGLIRHYKATEDDEKDKAMVFIQTGSLILVVFGGLIMLRRRFRNFDNYFTAIGIL